RGQSVHVTFGRARGDGEGGVGQGAGGRRRRVGVGGEESQLEAELAPALAGALEEGAPSPRGGQEEGEAPRRHGHRALRSTIKRHAPGDVLQAGASVVPRSSRDRSRVLSRDAAAVIATVGRTVRSRARSTERSSTSA